MVERAVVCLCGTAPGFVGTRGPENGSLEKGVLDKFASIQMLNVIFPTHEEGKELVFRRYTQPEKDHLMLLAQLNWELPEQAPPAITSTGTLMPLPSGP